MSWATRASLGELCLPAPSGGGWWLSAVPGEAAVPVSRDDSFELLARSSSTLQNAGLSAGDRVIASLSSDGDLTGAALARAAVEAGAEVVSVEPRGRMRLLATIRALRPNAWITTPCGALDFLARLYLEFNTDPLELDLEKIFLVGEIESPGTSRRLADEFESEVAQLYCDPFFGAALASSRGGASGWEATDPECLALGALGNDDDAGRAPTERKGEPAELLVRPHWSAALAEHTLRTGQGVGPDDTEPGLFQHTVGEYLLVRGRWLSLPRLRQVLAVLDGLAGFCLTVSRGDGTLDAVSLTLRFERESLVDNPMWMGRAREAVAGATPLAVEITSELAAEGGAGEQIVDERGHHLGVDRARIGGAGG